MSNVTLLDTGPLAAFLDRRELTHNQITSQFKEIRLPFITCEPVITEACFVLRHLPSAIFQIGAWITEGLIQIESPLEQRPVVPFSLMKKYRDLPMSLADACLVAMYEENPNSRVFTLDHHFTIYQTSKRRVIKTIGLE